MNKLVLEEIWSHRGWWIVAALLGLIGFVERNYLYPVLVVIIAESNYLLDNDISDCIYIIPISVKDYIKTRFRIAVYTELLLCVLLFAMYFAIAAATDKKISSEALLTQIFMLASLIIYVFVKNTWRLYTEFGVGLLKDDKCVQGVSFFIIFLIDIFVVVAEKKIMGPIWLTAGLAAVAGFAVYAIYICRYVKKHIVIDIYKIEKGSGLL